MALLARRLLAAFLAAAAAFFAAWVGAAFFAALVGAAFFAAWVGAAFFAALLGAAFFVALAGAALFAALVGAAFFAALAGAALFAAWVGAAFFTALVGAAFFTALLGAAFFVALAGATFFAALVGTAFFAALVGAAFFVALAGAALFTALVGVAFFVARFFAGAVFFVARFLVGAAFFVARFFAGAVFFGAAFFGIAFLAATFLETVFLAVLLGAAFFTCLAGVTALLLTGFCFGFVLTDFFAADFFFTLVVAVTGAGLTGARFVFAVFLREGATFPFAEGFVAPDFRVVFFFAIDLHPPLAPMIGSAAPIVPHKPGKESTNSAATPLKSAEGCRHPATGVGLSCRRRIYGSTARRHWSMGLRERLTFLSQLRADFVHTGAIQPSSRFLAAAMTQPLRDTSSGKARILEIGPGTGPVTRAIARSMDEHDELECYEINSDFAQYLSKTVREDPVFSAARDRIKIHNAPAQEMKAGEGFDFVVCSAPLNNFDAGTIEDIFRSSFAALRPGGTFTFFGYMVFPALRGFFARSDTLAKLAEAQAVKNDWIRRHAKGSRVVLLNLPPARVHHLEGLSP